MMIIMDVKEVKRGTRGTVIVNLGDHDRGLGKPRLLTFSFYSF